MTNPDRVHVASLMSSTMLLQQLLLDDIKLKSTTTFSRKNVR